MQRHCLACSIFVLGSCLDLSSGVGTHGDKKASDAVARARSNASSIWPWPWSTGSSNWDSLYATASLDELVHAKGNPFTDGTAPVMKGIDYMRAQVCAEMYRKHESEFNAFKECKEFMNKYCSPGDDQKMNGEEGEHPTGEGICRAFFSDHVRAGVKNVKKIADDIVDGLRIKFGGKGNYVEHLGVTLGYKIPGHSDWRGDPDDAWEKCEELGDACAGFTCESDGKSCSVRAPGPLKDSHTGEMSFVKPGADLHDHSHDHDDDDYNGGGHYGGNSGDSQSVRYKLHKGEVLIPGPISAHSSEYNKEQAKKLCSALPPSECAGFTCLDSEDRCTLRGGPDAHLETSKNGEYTYVRLDAEIGARASFSKYKLFDGKVLKNPVPDSKTGEMLASSPETTFSTDDAESRCDELPGCAGYTCDKSKKDCTVHGLGDLVDSQDGELTFLKDTFQSGGVSGSWTMDASAGLPEQGYHGRDVTHKDQDTLTKDWGTEYGPRSKRHEPCDAHGASAPSYWCKHRDRLRSGRSAAASSQMSLVLLSLIVTTNLR